MAVLDNLVKELVCVAMLLGHYQEIEDERITPTLLIDLRGAVASGELAIISGDEREQIEALDLLRACWANQAEAMTRMQTISSADVRAHDALRPGRLAQQLVRVAVLLGRYQQMNHVSEHIAGAVIRMTQDLVRGCLAIKTGDALEQMTALDNLSDYGMADRLAAER